MADGRGLGAVRLLKSVILGATFLLEFGSICFTVGLNILLNL